MEDDEARAILRNHGEEPPERGRLSGEWRARATHLADQDAGEDGEPSTTAAGPPPDDDGEPAAEKKPRRPRTSRPPLSSRLGGRKSKTRAKGGRAKPKAPRVPVDRLVGMAWEGLGRLFTPVSPPVGRCLQLQAPVAGLVLEDVVKGTYADRVLQPLARAEDKGKRVIALAAPPAIVMALEAAQQLPDNQRIAREAILVPMLREALILWHEVAGDKAEEQLARAESRKPAQEYADQMMAAIFGPPSAAPGGAGTPAGGDSEAAQAQQFAGAPA